MKKRLFSGLLAFVFLCTTLLLTFPQKVSAYQNSAYYSNIRIGLKSMANSSLTLTLNGAYSVNGQALSTGTTYTLSLSNNKILFNGLIYDSFTLISTSTNNTLSIKSGSTTNKYLGNMFFKIMNGSIFPINYLNIEDYLKGVVSIEMSDYFPIEALKSQAVAARNYTLSNLGLFNASGYDLTDSPDTQAYIGYNSTDTNVIKAVNDTRGMVQLYNDSLVQAYYSASNGGYEEGSENVWVTAMPYLKSKLDSFDNNAWANGNITFTTAQIESILKSKNYLTSTDKFLKLDLTNISRYISGRVSNIDVIYTNSLGTQLKISLSKTKAYSFLNLPSSLYTVTYNSSTNSYLFTGKGFGHGVGLSQLGAKARAASGQTYNSILNFYFDGSYTQSLLPIINGANINKTSTIVGQAVSVNVSAKGGSNSGYLYKYEVEKDNITVSTQDYSDSSTFTYSPSSAGNYDVNVYLLDKLSNQIYDDTKTLSFTAYTPIILQPILINKTATLTGQSVNVTASAILGSGLGYQYKFIVSKNGTSMYTQDYSSSNLLNYTPASAGNYAVSIYAKDAISTNNYDCQSSVNFAVYNAPTINSLNANKDSTLVNQAINFNTNVTEGSTSGYLYKYVTSNNGTPIFTQDYSNADILGYTPTTAGNYTISLYVKDVISSADYDATTNMNFTVYSTPQISNATFTGTLYEKRPVTVSAELQGGSGTPANYKFDVYSGTTLVTSQNLSTSSNFTFTPTIYGSYTVNISVKDGISTNTYDDTEQYPITIQKEPVVVSKLPISYGMKGSDVVQIQTGLTNLGYSLGTIDGIFGSKTYAAIISFQKSKGISQTGIVDQVTLTAINNALIAKLTAIP